MTSCRGCGYWSSGWRATAYWRWRARQQGCHEMWCAIMHGARAYGWVLMNPPTTDMTTAIITNPRHAPHDEPSHVERAVRLHAIEAALDASGLRADLVELAARPASEAQILAVHQPRMLEKVRWTANQELLWLG